jgi:hypothetical protein
MVKTCRFLSTGDPATLGSYRKLAVLAFGEASRSVLYLDRKIAESAQGSDEPVDAEEQMLQVLGALYLQECDEWDREAAGAAGDPPAIVE